MAETIFWLHCLAGVVGGGACLHLGLGGRVWDGKHLTQQVQTRCVLVGPILLRLLSRMSAPGLRAPVPGELPPSRAEGAGLAVLLAHL